MALHSFVTAGILATSFATAVLSLSFANLGAIDTLASGSTNIIATDPSENLHVSFELLSSTEIHVDNFYLCIYLEFYN